MAVRPELVERHSKAKQPVVDRQLVTLSCLAKKSNPKKAPPVCRPSGTLDQPQASGAAQLALVRRTKRASLRTSNGARLNLRLLASDLGGAQGKRGGDAKGAPHEGNRATPPFFPANIR